MSGDEPEYRDIQVDTETLVPAPEPIAAVQVESNPGVDPSSDEDPSEHEESEDEEVPVEVANGASSEDIPVEEESEDEEVPIEEAEGAFSEDVPAEEEPEDEFINPEIPEALIEMGALVHHLVDRNVELNIKLHTSENEKIGLEKRIQDILEEK